MGNQLQQIVICIHEDRLVSAAKQRSVATVANIVLLGINAVEMSHTAGQIGIRGLEQQMVMGWLQTIGCHFNIEQLTLILPISLS